MNDPQLFGQWRVETEIEILYELLFNATSDVWNLLPTRVTPVTMVIGVDGQLGGWWIGSLTAERAAEVRAAVMRVC